MDTDTDEVEFVGDFDSHAFFRVVIVESGFHDVAKDIYLNHERVALTLESFETPWNKYANGETIDRRYANNRTWTAIVEVPVGDRVSVERTLAKLCGPDNYIYSWNHIRSKSEWFTTAFRSKHHLAIGSIRESSIFMKDTRVDRRG